MSSTVATPTMLTRSKREYRKRLGLGSLSKSSTKSSTKLSKKTKKSWREKQARMARIEKLGSTKDLKKSDAVELKRHLFIFKTLSKQGKRSDIILKNAPLKLYKVLRLLFKMVLKGVFPLKPTPRNKLKKWAPFIRENSKGKDSDVKRRVSQNGEGLGDILKTVLPIITPILSLLI